MQRKKNGGGCEARRPIKAASRHKRSEALQYVKVLAMRQGNPQYGKAIRKRS